jgi:hypothetical protein
MGEKWPRILPKVATSTSLLGSFTCRKSRHGTDGFTTPPKEGVLRIFRPKNPTASAGLEPANLGTKGQHATSRPPKPLNMEYYHFQLQFCNIVGVVYQLHIPPDTTLRNSAISPQ